MENSNYGFLPNGSSTHSFKSISGMAPTRKGNIIACDSEEKKLVLLDRSGQYIRDCDLKYTPRDIAICESNMAVVMFAGEEENAIGIFDAETLKALTPDIIGENGTPYCVSNIGGTDEFITANLKITKKLSPKIRKLVDEHMVQVKKVCVGKVSKKSGDQLFTFFVCNNNTVGYSNLDLGSCAPIKMSQNELKMYNKEVIDRNDNFISIYFLKAPSDVTCDDNGNVYVSGKISDNILRLTEDAKVIDIPLNDQHGIRRPTAICFNHDFSKFYVAVAKAHGVDGMKILCFDVAKH